MLPIDVGNGQNKYQSCYCQGVVSVCVHANNKTIIKYKEPAAPFSQETPKEKQCTVQEYDKAEWMKDVKQYHLLFSVCLYAPVLL